MIHFLWFVVDVFSRPLMLVVFFVYIKSSTLHVTLCYFGVWGLMFDFLSCFLCKFVYVKLFKCE